MSWTVSKALDWSTKSAAQCCFLSSRLTMSSTTAVVVVTVLWCSLKPDCCGWRTCCFLLWVGLWYRGQPVKMYTGDAVKTGATMCRTCWTKLSSPGCFFMFISEIYTLCIYDPSGACRRDLLVIPRRAICLVYSEEAMVYWAFHVSCFIFVSVWTGNQTFHLT